jgi:predicted ABC-type ATPase
MPERRNEMDEISSAFGVAMIDGLEEPGGTGPKIRGRITMEKAVNFANRPGLTLRASKDPRYQRWQRNPEAPKAPKVAAQPMLPGGQGPAGGAPPGGQPGRGPMMGQGPKPPGAAPPGGAPAGAQAQAPQPPPSHVGQEVQFRHPVTGEAKRGVVRSSAHKGVTIQSHEGDHYRIEHGHYLRTDGGGADGGTGGADGGADDEARSDAYSGEGSGEGGGGGGPKSVGAAYAQAKGSGAAPDSNKQQGPGGKGQAPGSGGDAAPAEPDGTVARHWIDKSPEIPEDTKTHHSDENGNYTPGRKAFHDKVVDKFVNAAPSVPENETPVAIVMMGGPASGKSTGLRKLFDEGRLKQFVNVNPDDVKEELPEYQKATNGLGKTPDGKQITAKNAALLSHPESSDVADRVHQAALAQRKNMILDGTGKNQGKMEEKLKALKAKGYSVHLVMVHLDKDVAKKRQDIRAERTGRYVPDDVFHGAHDAIPQNFEPLSKHAHEATLIDNTGPNPQQVMKRGKDGVEVHDEDRWKAFQAHAKGLRERGGQQAGGAEDAQRKAPERGPGRSDQDAARGDGPGPGSGAGDTGPGSAPVGPRMEKAGRLVAGFHELVEALQKLVGRRRLEKGVTTSSLAGLVPEDLEGRARAEAMPEEDDDAAYAEELRRAEVHGWVDREES